MRRASRWVPPKPGMIPRLISGWPNFALSAAMTKSHARASSVPPPRAKPFTAAMTGIGSVSKERITPRPCAEKAFPSAALIVTIAEISAPATNARSPEPVMMRQRTEESWRTASTHAPISRTVAGLSALRLLGRFTVKTAIVPSCSNKMFSYAMSILRVHIEMVEGLHKTNRPRLGTHDNRVCGRTAAKEAHAFQVLTSGYASRGKHHIATHHVFCHVLFVKVINFHVA